jgi:hypothetical protein
MAKEVWGRSILRFGATLPTALRPKTGIPGIVSLLIAKMSPLAGSTYTLDTYSRNDSGPPITRFGVLIAAVGGVCSRRS